jgi:hypothetical protein
MYQMQKGKRFGIIGRVGMIWAVMLMLLLIGCQTVADCVIAIKPYLVSKELSNGIIGHSYDDSVTFEMQHADTDDYFISNIVIEGNFPQGLTYSLANGKTISFNGTPGSVGTFEFKVRITVRPYIYNSDGSDNLCGNVSTEDYKITVSF